MVAYLIKHIVTTAIIELRLRCMTTIIFTLQFLIYRTIHALHATACSRQEIVIVSIYQIMYQHYLECCIMRSGGSTKLRSCP